tara:strand:- start:7295 stop:8959 length:1665 start_codon:yes stop_codon:yes gene_type:complete
MKFKLNNFFKKKFPFIYINIKYIFYKVLFSKKGDFREILRFPYNNNLSINGYFKPLFNKKKNEGYFVRFYNTSFEKPSVLNFLSFFKNFNLFFIEIYKSKIISKKLKINIKRKNDLFILSHFESSNLQLEIKKEKKKQLFTLSPERFSIIRLDKGTNIISSKKKFICSDCFQKKIIPIKKKIVIMIFIDGFIFDKSNTNNLKFFPNISSMANSGVVFGKNYATAEWTLPSFASIITGKYTHNHGIFHPDYHHNVNEKNTLLQEYFQKNNFLTYQINSGKRSNPLYGYINGFDRTVFKENLDCKETVFETIDHLETFNQYNNFMFLGLNDLHHYTKINPPYYTQSKLEPFKIFNVEKTKNKSVNEAFNKNKIEILYKQMSYIDKYLGILFDYLKKDKNKDFICTIVTDHGHSYASKKNNILSSDKTRVPWLLFGTDIKKRFSTELTSNVDVLPTLLKLSKIKYDYNKYDGRLPSFLAGNNLKKRDIYTESFFPKQTFKVMIRNKFQTHYVETLNKLDSTGKINLKDTNYKKSPNLLVKNKVNNILKAWSKNNGYN